MLLEGSALDCGEMEGSVESVSLGDCCGMLVVESVLMLVLGPNSVLEVGCGVDEAEEPASTKGVRTRCCGSDPVYVLDVRAMKTGGDEVTRRKLRTTGTDGDSRELGSQYTTSFFTLRSQYCLDTTALIGIRSENNQPPRRRACPEVILMEWNNMLYINFQPLN